MFDIQPLSQLIERHAGGGTPSRSDSLFWDGNIPWASVKDFSEDSLELVRTQEHITEAGLRASTSNLIPPGIPLVCTRMAVGRAAVASMPVAINQDVRALFPNRGTDPRYLLRLLAKFQAKAEAQSVGSTVKGIRTSDYLSLEVPVAPSQEQPVIAEILDTLDTQIRQTEALISKLERVKQGLLTDLLTRGIDHNGQVRPAPDEAPHLYKNSPLGWIPKEWHSVRFGDLIIDAYRYPSYYGIDYVPRGVPEVRGELISSNGNMEPGLDKYRYISEDTASRFPRVQLSKGDIVMTVRGTIGKFALVEDWLKGAVITANLLKISIDQRSASSHWLIEVLLANEFQRRLDLACSSTTIPTIQVPELFSIYIALPELDEQKKITSRIFALKQRLKIEMEGMRKLQAQKAGLMDDLLTGRVRVTPLVEGKGRATA